MAHGRVILDAGFLTKSDRRVQDIDAALQGKGLQKVEESQKPDLLVTANGGMKEQTSYTAMGMRGWGGGMATVTPQQNVIGTLARAADSNNPTNYIPAGSTWKATLSLHTSRSLSRSMRSPNAQVEPTYLKARAVGCASHDSLFLFPPSDPRSET
jgi:hypothetical protein